MMILAPRDRHTGTKGKYMKNKCFKRDIFGDKPTQKMAQKTLPELVSKAQEPDIIRIRDLAEETAPDLTRFNWSMKWAFQWIQTTLYKLERSDEWNYGEIPGITAIVVIERGKPTNAMVKRNRSLSWNDYETNYILPVFEYPHWDKVMDFVS